MAPVLGRQEVEALAARVVAGERRALARALRWVDDVPIVGHRLAAALHAHARGTQVVGVTGVPGAGKSTVVDVMIASLRQAGKRVAVLAVDPSSPFSGGAILGDRIRMGRHALDDGVFIRSMATRGALGGLSRSTFDSTRVLDAAGFDIILIETVGVGQDEVDVVRLAHTTVVVMVPGLGDDVQAIKAGLFEIADIFLINKADRDGADDVERNLKQVLTSAPATTGWEPKILRSIATREQGIESLIAAIAEHDAFNAGQAGEARRRRQTLEIFDRLLDAALVERSRNDLAAPINEARRRIEEQDADPYGEVLRLVGDESVGDA